MDKQEKKQPIRELLARLPGHKNWLFALGLAGILLIGLSDLMTGTPPAAEAQNENDSTMQTEQMLEQRLEKLLAQVDGAGEVQVMITLENTGETIYAQDSQAKTQEQTDGSSVVRSSDRSSEHILYDAGTGSQALVETRLEPSVKGVAVLCAGGGDITVVKRITDLVATVLDVPTNRVCVAKMS